MKNRRPEPGTLGVLAAMGRDSVPSFYFCNGEVQRLLNSTDVFVIGGGPAGLAAAIAARQQGFRVMVADGAQPPIDKALRRGPDAGRPGRAGAAGRSAAAGGRSSLFAAFAF